MMWPLLLCSLVAGAVSIERLWWLWRWYAKRDTPAIRSIFVLAERGQWGKAFEEAKASRDPTVRVIEAGLKHHDHGPVEAMQVAAEDQVELMQRSLSVLDTIITMAPLLGILGTVLGIINSFNLLSNASINDPRAISGGIAEALITTAAGLTIAVLTLIPYNYFQSRVVRTVRELEKLGTEFELACRRGRALDPASPQEPEHTRLTAVAEAPPSHGDLS